MKTIVLMAGPYYIACDKFRMSEEAKRYYERKARLEKRENKEIKEEN